MNQARFAYAQARLQARHGLRPQEAVWRRLASTGDLANYLVAARRTQLRPWTEGIQSADTSHALEYHLRQQFRRYVEDVAHWLPVQWRACIIWIRHLPDLPALQFLLQAESAPGWMRDDPDLSKFTTDSKSAVFDTLPGSDRAYLSDAWRRGVPLYEAWFEHWQCLWPAKRDLRNGLVDLGHLVRQHLHDEQAAALPAASHLQETLAAGLNSAFRRYSFKPAAACAHLGLVALDVKRLRGELVHRALFDETTAMQA